MKKKPWHLCRPDGTNCDRQGTNENAFWNHSLSEFWLEPVRDHGELGTHTNASQPPPVNEGRLYGNTLQLRAHKLRLMRQV